MDSKTLFESLDDPPFHIIQANPSDELYKKYMVEYRNLLYLVREAVETIYFS